MSEQGEDDEERAVATPPRDVRLLALEEPQRHEDEQDAQLAQLQELQRKLNEE